jgi:hypothetical protein
MILIIPYSAAPVFLLLAERYLHTAGKFGGGVARGREGRLIVEHFSAGQEGCPPD